MATINTVKNDPRTQGLKVVNIHEAKTLLSRLVEEAAQGQSFIIAKGGKPMVKVIALNEPEPEPEIRRLGFFTGEMIVPDDFDTLYQDEIEEMFYGKE
jgi:antitoxin (DNA-binding transcriptional repressor) of toxin-antitoxin stability system